MKIWYEFPRPAGGAEGFYKLLQANWKKAGHADSQLTIKAPTKGTSEFKFSIIGHMYADTLRTIEMIEGIMQAEREGYDAGVIGCFGDPGLDVLENLVDSPVTGPAKAAILLAQAVGSRMAFITLPHWEKKIERIIDVYGVRNLVIGYRPCRPFTLPLEKFKNEEDVVNNALEIAAGAAKDGADAVVVACVNTSTLLTYRGISSVNRTPILDGAVAALKMAEMMVDLKKAGLWKSKRAISADVIEGLRSGYYHGSESV